MDSLQQARLDINEIDKEMAALFERRMRAAKVIAEYKKERGLQIYDAQRERAVIEKNSAYIEDYDIRSYYVRFLDDVMAVSKQYQESVISGVKIAYSGVEGAYADIAAKRIFPYGRQISYPDFRSAYEAVVSGECECCVLPLENSYAGEVGAVMDMLFQGSLYVNGVYSLRIVHNLLGVDGADIGDIQRVVSHPQALAQCAGYIRGHGWEIVEYANTAKAAKAVRDSGDKSVVIAPDGRLYHCEHLPGNTSYGTIFEPEAAVRSDKRADLPAGTQCRTCCFLPQCTPFYRNGCSDYFECCKEYKQIDAEEAFRRLM